MAKKVHGFYTNFTPTDSLFITASPGYRLWAFFASLFTASYWASTPAHYSTTSGLCLVSVTSGGSASSWCSQWSTSSYRRSTQRSASYVRCSIGTKKSFMRGSTNNGRPTCCRATGVKRSFIDSATSCIQLACFQWEWWVFLMIKYLFFTMSMFVYLNSVIVLKGLPKVIDFLSCPLIFSCEYRREWPYSQFFLFLSYANPIFEKVLIRGRSIFIVIKT